jgi:mannosyltransferase
MSNTADAPAPVRTTGASRQPQVDPATVEVVVPNFKRRLSGVTSTVLRVLPEQARSLRAATLGIPLEVAVPRIPWRRLTALWRRAPGRRFRIWHARRNLEMAGGVLLRDVLGMRLRLVFTSAAQRHHAWWTRFLIRRMDAVIATSAKSASYLRVPSTVIPHGVDPEAFRPPASRAAAKAALGYGDGTLIGCFGRIRPDKGTDVFVEAMVALLPSFPNAQAAVLGRATDEHQAFLNSLERRVADAGLAGRIAFAGEVPSTAPWYQALDLYVAPQRWEGFGVTPLEAGAYGLPVVATTAGAFPDIVVDGETGTLVPPGDLPAMTEAIRALLADPDRRRRFGLAARQRIARDFSLAREAAAINAVYQRLWDALR